METRANYVLIGAFVLLATTAITTFVLWLASSQFNRDYAQYDIVFPGPVSLEEGAAVRYIGIKVGEVDSVGIDRRDASMVRARIRVDRSTPVKEDSTASIQLAGITGVTFIQINAGSENAGPLTLKDDQTVPVITAEPDPLAELFASGADLAGRANRTLDQAGLLLSDENLARAGNALASLDKILGTIAADDEVLLSDVRKTLASLEQAGDDLALASRTANQLGGQANTELVELSGELEGLLGDLRRLSGEAEAGLAEGRAALESARILVEGSTTQTLEDARLATTELRILITRMDQLMRELEQNPQNFVLGNPLPYEEAR